MDNLRTLLDQLEDTRLDYVVARSQVTSDAGGYNNAGISKAAFYKWDPDERDKLNALAQRLKREVATRALMKLQDAAEDAAETLANGLKSRNEHIKQRAADSILDRVIGRATQTINQDVTSGGEKITVNIIEEDDTD